MSRRGCVIQMQGITRSPALSRVCGIAERCAPARGVVHFFARRRRSKGRGFSNELFVGEELDLSWRLQGMAKEADKEIVDPASPPAVTSRGRWNSTRRGSMSDPVPRGVQPPAHVDGSRRVPSMVRRPR